MHFFFRQIQEKNDDVSNNLTEIHLQKLTETVQVMHKTMEELSKNMTVIKESLNIKDSNDKMPVSLSNSDE